MADCKLLTYILMVIANMHDNTEPSEPQPLKPEAVKSYMDNLSAEDRLLLKNLFSGSVSHDMHSAERTKRLYEMLQDLGLWKPEPKQSYDDRVEMYRKFGLEVTIPKGRCGFSENLMCAPYDGVPYCIDDHGNFFKNCDDRSILKGIRHREMMIERHHEQIKQVYEHCTSLDRGDIWVLCGGGAQMQAFFGCSNGYLAILYLSLEGAPSSTPEELRALSKKSLTLQPQFEHNEPLFKGLKIPGVKVQYFPRSTLEP